MSKTHRVNLQPAYVLHAWPWQESSALVECFSRDYGRVRVVAKGVRRATSRWRGFLQPFVLLCLSWTGRTDLYTLTQAEIASISPPLAGESLLYGFYLNEILLRVLPREDAHPKVYAAYQQLLQGFALAPPSQLTLRVFEWQLLRELGYGFSLRQECDTDENIQPEHYYDFIAPRGFVRNSSGKNFCGEHLLNFAKGEARDALALREIKRLMRLALSAHLGERPLKTRELFI